MGILGRIERWIRSPNVQLGIGWIKSLLTVGVFFGIAYLMIFARPALGSGEGFIAFLAVVLILILNQMQTADPELINELKEIQRELREIKQLLR